MARPTNIQDARRDALARKLAADGISWPVVTLTRQWGAFQPGTVFYGVPSSTIDRSTGQVVRYMANEKACNCHDYQKSQNICKHVRAVRIYEHDEGERLNLATLAEVDAATAGIAADATARQDAYRRAS